MLFWTVNLITLVLNISVSGLLWVDRSVVMVPPKSTDQTARIRLRSARFISSQRRWARFVAFSVRRLKRRIMPRKWPFTGALHIDKTGKTMVYIPPGRFIMGSTKGDPDEKPLHPVWISKGFWMDQTEVTGDEYQKCVDAGVCRWKYKEFVWPWPPKNREEARQISTKYCKGYRAHRRARYPVNCIPWPYTYRYCTVWRKGRLPSEAEWEWAARGGLKQKTYSWGDDPIHGRGVLDRRIGPAPVAQYPPNGYGLYDMTGNVWEWVNDWYDWGYYKRGQVKDPRGPCNGSLKKCGGFTDRSMRGGSWYEDGSGLRVAYRNHHGPHYTYRVVGFRCAADFQKSK